MSNEEFTHDMKTEDVKPEEKKTTEKKFNLGKELFEWFYTIVIAIAIAFTIKGFLFDFVIVDGPSMHPTLVHGDRLIITKIGYKPEMQDIIVLDATYKNRQAYYDSLEKDSFIEKTVEYFKLPEGLKQKFYVKRVIALPGQTVDIIEGKVYVDGKLLEEDYYDGLTSAHDPLIKFPFTVSDDSIFVMGDNRPASLDSRYNELGEVPLDAVIGKCVFRILPFKTFGVIEH